MPDLNLSFTLAFNKADCDTISKSETSAITVSGTYSQAGSVQSIATSDTVVTVPAGIGTVGVCLFKNLDPTNYIEIGNDGSSYPVRLKGGEKAMFRFNGTIHAKANTGACKLATTAIEA